MVPTRQIVGASALFIGYVTLASSLQAQPIYRCVNSYSQTPCPGGTAIDVQDSRSPAQKAQSDAATAQAARLANEMEKTRLKDEQIAGKNAKAPDANTKSVATKGVAAKHVRGHEDALPSPFVAFAPPWKKPGAKKSPDTPTKP